MGSNRDYQHTQVALVNVAVLVLVEVPLIWLATQAGGPWAMLVPALVFVVGLVWFSNMTVRVDDRQVECRFGPGLLRKRVALADVASVAEGRNSLLETGGWGIRSIPGGSTWTLSGFAAVELRLQQGGVFRIGTDAPERLAEEIERRLARRANATPSRERDGAGSSLADPEVR